MAGETSTPKKPNKNSNQNKGKTNRTTVNDKENKPAKDSGGGATSQRRRRPRKKPQEKSVKTSQSSTVDELAAGVKKIELSPGQQNDEKPKAGKRYTTSFWRRERKQSEKESAVKDETAEKGKEGNQSDDDCNNIWGKEIVYDIDYWKNYTPLEPTEEEKFRIHTPGRKLRGYDDTPVELSGPEPKTFELVQSFKQAPLASAVLSNVQKSSFEKPTPVQKYAIPVIFSGRDFMACAPTGSGKTAAYLLPIISNLLKMGDDLPGYSEIASPLALILLPTQDLAQQIYVDALRFTHKTDIRVVRVYGQCSHEEQILQLNNECGCHIVIATPGRLLTFMKELGNKPCEISLGKVKYFVLDEADHMLVRYKSVYKHGDSDTGSDLGSLSDSDGDDVSQAKNKSMAKSGFYHDVKKIVRRCEVYPEHSMPPKESRQTLMFSASLPKKFQWYARKKFLRDDYLHLLVGDEVASTCPDVEQVVLRVPAKEKRDKLLAILQEELKDKPKRIVVFVRHKKRFNNQRARDSVSEIVRFLSNNGMNVTGISSGRVQQEREESLREFRGKKGESEVAVPIIVATAVGSRGLDIEGVELVINYDLPDTRYVGIEEYVHKVGRTGRIGNPGKAISFFDEEKDMEIARSLRKELREFVPEWLDEICESNKAFGTKEDHKLLVSRDIRYISRRFARDMFISLLPEIRDQILFYCSCTDLQNLARTCRHCNDILKEKLFVNVQLPPHVLRAQTPVDESITENLEHTKRLRFKEGSNVEAEDLERITRLHGLQELNIRGSKCTTDNDLATVCDTLTGLRVLDAGHTRITDAGLVHLRRLPNLREVVMDSCRLSDDGLARLSECGSLRKIDVSSSYNITSTGIASLTKLEGLDELVLRMCGLRNTAVSYVSKILSLRKLDLSYQTFLTDGGMKFLCALKGLEDLKLAQCTITDAGLQHMSGLQKLKHLDLFGCSSVTDRGLQHLSNLSQLEQLLLGCCSITNIGLKHLTTLTSLRELDLNACQGITDEGLEWIHPLHSLEVLELRECNVTNNGLLRLQSCLSSLKKLSVNGCQGVSSPSKMTSPFLRKLTRVVSDYGDYEL